MGKAYAPEQIEETEHLDHHADGWPFEKDEEDPAEEADRPTQLVLAREKVERLLWADDEEEAAEEEDLGAVRARRRRGVGRGAFNVQRSKSVT
jgi:hypothetical protein